MLIPSFGLISAFTVRLLTRRFIGDYDGTLGKLITKLITRLNPPVGKIKQILCSDWLPERVRWGHLARSGFPAFLSRKKKFCFWPYNKSFIDQAWSVKIAGY